MQGDFIETPDYAYISESFATEVEGGIEVTNRFGLIEDPEITWGNIPNTWLYNFMLVFDDPTLPDPPFISNVFVEGRNGNRQFISTWIPGGDFLLSEKAYLPEEGWTTAEETSFDFWIEDDKAMFLIPEEAIGEADRYGFILRESIEDNENEFYGSYCHTFGVDIDTGYLEIPVSAGKVPSTVEFELERTTITIGDRVTLTGTTSIQEDDSSLVDIYISSNDGATWNLLTSVETTDSEFSYSWTPLDSGSFLVYVTRLGDNIYSSATSSIESLTIQKASSSLTIFSAESRVVERETINIRGNLEPAIDGETVIVTFSMGDRVVTKEATTNQDGEFFAHLRTGAEDLGEWSVEASYEENETYEGTTSNTLTFDVIKYEPVLIIHDFDLFDDDIFIVEQGESLPLTGGLTGGSAGEVVTLFYEAPDGSVVEREVLTDEHGDFMDFFPTDHNTQTGVWSVRASWAGNDEIVGVVSDLSDFEVTPQGGGLRIPGYPIVALVIGVTVVILQKRKLYNSF